MFGSGASLRGGLGSLMYHKYYDTPPEILTNDELGKDLGNLHVIKVKRLSITRLCVVKIFVGSHLCF